jgi:SAM-dependent methyltransferase
MLGLATDVVWRNRLRRIACEVEDVRIPNSVESVDQDEEWCEITVDGEKREVRFHDYSDVFGIPGLYEELFYCKLECCSPSYVSNLLESVVRENGDHPEGFRVLDVGAGNGMVGEELKNLGVDSVIGIDIIRAAKDATDRDRPEVYDDYLVADLTDLPEDEKQQLLRADVNCLTTVAALGFGDIPPLAFAKSLDLISTPGWLAFNLKEDFIRERDTSGFSRLIRKLNRDGYIQTLCNRRYQHRISTTGKPLYYVAVIARKIKDLDHELWEALETECQGCGDS